MESAFRCEFSDNASAIFPAATGVKFVAFSRLQSELNLAARTESSETVSNLTDSGISAGRLIVISSVAGCSSLVLDDDFLDFLTTIAFDVVIVVCCDRFFKRLVERNGKVIFTVYDHELIDTVLLKRRVRKQ